MTHFKKLLVLTPLLIAGLSTAAHAQFARNDNAPIDATADNIVNSAGVTILKGQVDVRQGTTRILADEMEIYSTSNTLSGSGSEIDRIVAKGNFYYLTPEQEVRGAQGLYTGADNSFTVTGDVILLQGENVVTGDRLIYDLDTEKARVIGTCQGRRCGSTGRVNILIKNTDNSQ